MPEADADAAPAPTTEAPAHEGPGIFSNSLTNILGLVAVSTLGALGGLLTARHLGPAGMGVLAVTWGFVEFGRALTSCTHIPSIQKFHQGRSADVVFGTSLAVKLVGSALFIGVMVILAEPLARLFGIPPLGILLAASVLLIGSFFEVGAARLEAQNKMVRSNLILVSGSIMGLLAVVLLAATNDLTVYTSILTTLVANATMSLGAARFAYSALRLRVELALGVEMTKYGLRIVAASLLAQGLIWTDTLMVSALVHDANVSTGIYNVVFQLTFVMVTASTAMGVALVPALAQLVGRGEDTSLGYQRGTLIALSISLAISLVYVVAGRFILSLYGELFLDGYPALLILTAFGIAAALAVPASTMLTIHGHAGVLTGLSLAQLALNLPLNYLLITRLGMTGAAIATTCVFVSGTLLSWWLVRRLTGALPFSRVAFREGWDAARRFLRLA